MRFPFARSASRSLPPPFSGRGGMTLIEMLVAMAITLMIVFAMVRLFQWFGDGITASRASMEQSGQLRNAIDRLRQDLDHLTVRPVPPVDAGASPGYLEIVEGYLTDAAVIDDGNDGNDMLGDYDDLLMFTATSPNEPFLGRYKDPGGSGETITIQSQDAEIVWWVELQDLNQNGVRDPGELYNIHRRVFLILPSLNDEDDGYLVAGDEAALIAFQRQYDISVRLENIGGTTYLVANSLGDLSIRANRFAHVQGQSNYPNHIRLRNDGAIPDSSQPLDPLADDRLGEDIVLADVLAFDLKVYDPLAVLRSDGTVALAPSDPGWDDASNVLGYGDFVDLNYTGFDGLQDVDTHFSDPPYGGGMEDLVDSAYTSGRASAVYDTWTTFYERDGLDQDGSGTADQGTNGLDDDTANGADDPDEAEAPPPYPFPLRGLQVTVRTMDLPTRQVKQSSAVVDFSTD